MEDSWLKFISLALVAAMMVVGLYLRVEWFFTFDCGQEGMPLGLLPPRFLNQSPCAP